jgi:hypothetical protein
MPKIALLFILILSLSSCSLRPRLYNEPTTGPTSTIEFKNNGTGIGTVEFFRESETCRGREYSETIEPGSTIEKRVKANEQNSFSLGYHITGSSLSNYSYCRVYVTFEPKENDKYFSEIKPNNKGCTLLFYTISDNGKAESAPGFRKREGIRSPWDENSSFCK